MQLLANYTSAATVCANPHPHPGVPAGRICPCVCGPDPLFSEHHPGISFHVLLALRFVGTTVKLVLENVGEGMEALQMQLREHFLQASPGLAERLRDGGDHLVEFRLLCNAADTRDRFFMEGTVAFKGEERVAKKLMKLYRDNIARCKGNLRDEIEWLVPQMLCAELMEEEELEALTRLEEEVRLCLRVV